MNRSCRKCKYYRGERVDCATLYVYPTYQGASKAHFYVLECDAFGIPFGSCEGDLHVKLARECPFYEEREVKT